MGTMKVMVTPERFSFAFARILGSLLQRGSAFAKGYGATGWRGDRAVARESEGG